MFDPIFDDGYDEFGESTYKIVGYEVEETPTLVTDDVDMEELAEEATGRSLKELLEYSNITVVCERKRYDLYDFITLPMKKFIGKEVTFECDYED